MRKLYTIPALLLSAGMLFFAACGDDSSSSSPSCDGDECVIDEDGDIKGDDGNSSSSKKRSSSSSRRGSSSDSSDDGDDGDDDDDSHDGSGDSDNPKSSSSSKPASSSSIERKEMPTSLCKRIIEYTEVKGDDGETYVCLEGKTLFKIDTYDSLEDCDDYQMGTIAWVVDEEEPYTCEEHYSWRHGIFEVDLNPVHIEAGGACPDSLAGKELFSNELNGDYACKGGIWVLIKSYERSSSSAHVPVPVDYSKGRAMNKKLGKGINFGNSWDATGSGDGGWSNPINDGDFATIKAAGFNSVRIPVRWNHKNSGDMDAIKADVQTAISQGLVVIINYHHYDALNEIGGKYAKDPSAYKSQYEQEKQNFVNKWKEVAREMDKFPDNNLILEVWNEPTIASAEVVNELMLAGYNAIRSVTKTKTIMFEAYHAAKFYDLDKFDFPADGNIIYSGHYYEPFAFSHQGHGYECKGDAAYKTTAAADMKSYLEIAKKYYPDVDGVNTIPLNMGEFGIAGQCGVSDSKRAQWTKEAVKAAESVGMSWTYWCFKNCGGFEAWSGNWKSGFLDAFGL